MTGLLPPTAALETGAILCPISPSGLLQFSGEESQHFLHGQLSSDINALSEESAQYSSYSTPKGRMLASFLAFRMAGDYWLQLDKELAPALQKRLSMYIMRSKTRCVDATFNHVLLGVAGTKAAELIEAATDIPPKPTLSVQHTENFSLISLPGERFQFVTRQDYAPLLEEKLRTAGCTPASEASWILGDIRAGIPWITAATQEEFIPQMTNLDLIDGVSFSKGCYPGQEIVARTRYIGKIKRRMFRACVTSESVTIGQDVYSPEMNGQACGKIVLAAEIRTGEWETLLAVQISSLKHGLHLGGLNGPTLEMLPLPYAIE